MAVLIADAAFDAALDHVRNNATSIHVTAGAPTAMAAGAFTGATEAVEKTGLTSADFTAPGDATGGGRKITSNAHNGVSISATVTGCDHVVLTNGTDTIYAISPLSAAVDLTSGNEVNIAAFDVRFPDAVEAV